MSRITRVPLPLIVGCALFAPALVIASAGGGAEPGFVGLSDHLLSLVAGTTDSFGQLQTQSIACAAATFPAGTVVDCSSWSNGTPCGTCSGLSNARFNVIGTTGGPGADSTGGFLACGQGKQAPGTCQGGTCNGTPTQNKCGGNQIAAYIEEP